MNPTQENSSQPPLDRASARAWELPLHLKLSSHSALKLEIPPPRSGGPSDRLSGWADATFYKQSLADKVVPCPREISSAELATGPEKVGGRTASNSPPPTWPAWPYDVWLARTHVRDKMVRMG